MMDMESGIGNTKLRVIFFTLTVVSTAWMASPGDSLALQKRPGIYNVCVCACSDPSTGFGELVPDIQNTAGVSCEVYNSRPCTIHNEDGSTTGGRTKYCQGYKPGGTKAMTVAPSVLQNAPTIQRRGVETESSTVEGSKAPEDLAVPMSNPGNVRMNCSCEGGNGSCSVTSTDGKISTCHKGDGDTCTGSCAYPKATISGAE